MVLFFSLVFVFVYYDFDYVAVYFADFVVVVVVVVAAAAALVSRLYLFCCAFYLNLVVHQVYQNAHAFAENHQYFFQIALIS